MVNPIPHHPQQLLLWPEGAPLAKGEAEADRPVLHLYLPLAEIATGTAVVVCPGGGYGGLATDHEGRQIAEWLNARGVAACVVYYRVAPYRHPVPLMDAQRAIRTVRANAEAWGIDPNRIGIWGFSAGGHLSATASNWFDAGNYESDDPIERTSCRPDFAVLAYPVITFLPPFAHMGSRYNLLGADTPDTEAQRFSMETQVTAQTPPTFLFHTGADPGVPVENSIHYYLALRAHGVDAELHVYEQGRHGVGLAQDDPVLCTWSERLEAWMQVHGWTPGAHETANAM